MREIKFRAYGNFAGKLQMQEVAPIKYVDGEWDIFWRGSVFHLDVPIMQYTGLKDKNGKEIYEGDIIRCFDTAGEVVYDDKVVRMPDFYMECWSSRPDGMPAEEGDRTGVEVIGNIYENPELIK